MKFKSNFFNKNIFLNFSGNYEKSREQSMKAIFLLIKELDTRVYNSTKLKETALVNKN